MFQPQGNETQHLVDFCFKTFHSELPSCLESKLIELIADQIGVQIGCSKFPWSKAVYNYHNQFVSRGRSTVVNYGAKMSPEQAAFINAAFGHGQDYDDTCLKVQTHSGAVVVPVAIAVGEEVGASGSDVLRAIAAGTEVMLRAAHAVSPECLKRGHHTPPAAGPYGAAVAAGLLLGLDKLQLLNAMGITGSFSGGLIEYTQSGGSVKRIHTAIPTTAGVKAAYLAKQGITGPAKILEGEKGFCRVFANNPVVERLTHGLSDSWLIESVSLKAYNCCYFIHAPLEAFLSLCQDHELDSCDIEEVKVGTSKHGTIHVGRIPQPTDALGAQFSLHFTLALALIKEMPGLLSYSEEALGDVAVRRFSQSIQVYEDDVCSQEYPSNWGGVVTIRTKNRQEFQRRVRHPKGSVENPMTREQVKAKFFRNVSEVLDRESTEKLYDQLMNLQQVKHISSVANAATVVSADQGTSTVKTRPRHRQHRGVKLHPQAMEASEAR